MLQSATANIRSRPRNDPLTTMDWCLQQTLLPTKMMRACGYTQSFVYNLNQSKSHGALPNNQGTVCQRWENIFSPIMQLFCFPGARNSYCFDAGKLYIIFVGADLFSVALRR